MTVKDIGHRTADDPHERPPMTVSQREQMKKLFALRRRLPGQDLCGHCRIKRHAKGSVYCARCIEVME